MRIVETDNFARDYPNEKFVNIPRVSEERAKIIAKAINECFDEEYDRYWKVVPDDYILEPGFEP